jgi:cobalt-zinc-cadmium efflux system outer membrane protein
VKLHLTTKQALRSKIWAILACILIPSFILLFFANVVRAESDATAPPSQACSRLASPQDVIDCALSNHPEAQRARLSNQQAENLEDAASQRPNPEIAGKSVFGSSLGDDVINHELNLAHTVELGGKRGARMDKALAEKETVAASSQRSREEVLLETLHSLYRLRQIQAELHTLDEALETFGRIQRQFRSRPRRTPEQEVSLGVFDIAEGDYQLRRAALEVELATHTREIELATGREFEPSGNVLPPKRKSWPKLQDETAPASFKGSAMNSVRAGLKLAEAELSVAQSLSWPNLKIGPSFESQTSGPFTFQTYGVNLSFELPIFQINGGGRAVARTGLDLAERSLTLRERELSNQRKILLQKYDFSVKAVQTSLTHSELEKKHRSTDALFARGIIPSSLVIEAHRQIVDFTKNQNEQELSALEALWKIYVLEGRAFEEKL